MSPSNTSLPPRSHGGTPKGKVPPKKKKKKSGFKTFLKFVLILIILAVLAVAGYAGYLYYKADHGVLDTGVDAPVAPSQSAKVKPITMLLLGTDYRPETKTHLSDVIMIAAFNPDTKSATLVSVPRDTKIELKGYRENKANAYYPNFLADEKQSGIKATDEMKTMFSKYLDIDIDYVTVLNFQAFRDAVDALGGVDVTVDKNMCYRDKADGTDINLKKGEQELNGKQALDFVRYRKSNCRPRTDASDDFDRNRRQNEVLHSLIDKMQTFKGVTSLGGVLDAMNNNMETDIEKDQLKNIIATYWKIKKEDVKFMPITGNWKSPYVYVDDDELDKAKQALKDELAGKAAVEAGTSADESSNP
ncbi:MULTISPECIES: LCP family protein [Paenibacillus]|uniref:Transcriptional regulator n=1 Tax=Paenibacillus cineris TaxID=237530 RepID=A0ABQ4LGC6_9BACL|nr:MULTISPECIES: LCP family protein [Paenibacillus]GIO55594.1 transcriptional regulator [Paenibacillus cineris]